MLKNYRDPLSQVWLDVAWFIRCPDCGAEGPKYEDADSALEAWLAPHAFADADPARIFVVRQTVMLNGKNVASFNVGAFVNQDEAECCARTFARNWRMHKQAFACYFDIQVWKTVSASEFTGNDEMWFRQPYSCEVGSEPVITYTHEDLRCEPGTKNALTKC